MKKTMLILACVAVLGALALMRQRSSSSNVQSPESTHLEVKTKTKFGS